MRFHIIPLEERIVLDAAGATSIIDSYHFEHHLFDSHIDKAGVLSSTSNALTIDHAGTDAGGVRVLVVSSQVQNAQVLAQAASNSVKVVFYDPNNTSLSQLTNDIASVLHGAKAQSIAFATDGSNGQFNLIQGLNVSLSTLKSHTDLQAFWNNVGNMLKTGGRIDILSCNVAGDSAGLNLVHDLQNEINAHDKNHITVAASTDITGNSSSGGNWKLEVGNINASTTYFDTENLADWNGNLDTLLGIATVANVQQTASPDNHFLVDQITSIPDGATNISLGVRPGFNLGGGSANFQLVQTTSNDGHIIVNIYATNVLYPQGDFKMNGVFDVFYHSSVDNQDHTYSQIVSNLDVNSIANPITSSSPTITSAQVGTIIPSDTTVATFLNIDPNIPPVNFQTTIDWGDGTFDTNAFVTDSNGIYSIHSSTDHIYTNTGTENISISVTESGLRTPSFFVPITVGEAPITLFHATPQSPIQEGTSVSNTTTLATFADPNTNLSSSDFTATIDWGDNTTSIGVISGSNGNFTIQSQDNHQYVQSGTYTISISAQQVNHAEIIATDTTSINITNAPIIATGSSFSTPEGSILSGQVATFTDTNTAAPSSEFTASIDWGDSTAPVSVSVSGSNGNYIIIDSGNHAYSHLGTYNAVVTIFENGIAIGSATDTVIVTDLPLSPPKDNPPSISIANGTTLNLNNDSFTFSDQNLLGAATDFTANINWGDGTSSFGTIVRQADSGGQAIYIIQGSHQYTSAGADVLSVTIQEIGGSQLIIDQAVNVYDILNPSTPVSFSGTSGLTFGSGAILANFTDLTFDEKNSTLTATIDWGDGSALENASILFDRNTKNFEVFSNSGHSYGTNIDTIENIKITITDSADSSHPLQIITPIDISPIYNISTADFHAVQGTSSTLTIATFLDSNPNADITKLKAIINWGDGSSPETLIGSSYFSIDPQNSGLYDLIATHTYTATGSYTVNVSISGGNPDSPTRSDTGIAEVGLTTTFNEPTITAPTSLHAEGNLPITGITIANSDGYNETVVIQVAHGILVLSQTDSLISGNNTNTLVFQGSLSNINNDLASLVYSPDLSFVGHETMTITANDNGQTLVATSSIDIDVTQAFSITHPVSAEFDTSLSFTGTNAISIVDPANGLVVVNLYVDNGALHFEKTNLKIFGSGIGKDPYRLEGSLQDVNAALSVLSYTPDNANSSDNLHITAVDVSTQLSSLTIIPLTLGNSNPLPPVANNDSYQISEASPLSASSTDGVLANDTSSHTGLTALLVTGPAHAAQFTLNSDGSFTYTPDSDFVGSDTFTYTAVDSNLVSETATVTIQVNNVEPTINVTSPNAINEGSTATINVALSDPGNDHPVITSFTTGLKQGVLVDNHDGTYTYDPQGYIGTAFLTFNSTDDNNGTSTNTISIEVDNVSPTITLTGPSAINEGSPGVINVALSDPGTDIPHITTFSADHGIITDNHDGTYTFNSQGYVGTAVLTFDATDDQNGTSTKTINIEIDNVIPTISLTGPSSIIDGSTALIHVTLSDPGTDNAHITTFSTNHGKLTDNHDGTYTYDPQGYIGTAVLTFNATDDNHGDNSNSIEVTTNINSDVLTVTGISNLTTQEGNSISTPLATFTDTLNSTQPTDFTALISWGDNTTSVGQIHYLGNNQFSVTDPSNHYYATPGTYTIIVTINHPADSTSQQVSETILVSPSKFTFSTPTTIGNNTTSNFVTESVLITDSNIHTLLNTITANISWGDNSTSIGNITSTSIPGQFLITASHAYSQGGNYTTNIHVSENQNVQDILNIINVPTANADAYSVNSSHNLVTNASNGVLANDSGIGLTAKLIAGPSHGSLALNADGSFSYTASNAYIGTDSFTYEIINKNGVVSNLVTDTLNVAPAAINLELGGPQTLKWTSNNKTLTLAPQVNIYDPGTDNFNNGQLIVKIANNANSHDSLSIISHERVLKIKGHTLLVNGVRVGTFQGGNGTHPLVITFNQNASTNAVDIVTRNIVFSDLAKSPPTGQRTIQFQLTDGSGRTSNIATKLINFKIQQRHHR